MNFLQKMIVIALVTAIIGVGVCRIKEATSNRLHITMYTAVWCPSCVRFKPIFEEVRKSMSERMDFEAVDVDEQRRRTQDARVKFVPTIVVTRGEKVLWRSDVDEANYANMGSAEGFSFLLEILDVQ